MYTDLSCIGFPGHEAVLCVNIPHTNMSTTGGGKQEGVHVVAQSRHLYVPSLSWCFRSVHLQQAMELSVCVLFGFVVTHLLFFLIVKCVAVCLLPLGLHLSLVCG